MGRLAASPWSVIAFALALGVSTCQCQQTGPPLSRHARRIKSHVAALHRGVQVTVVIKNGSVYRGEVNHLEEVAFWLDQGAQTQPVRISYNDVSKIKPGNFSPKKIAHQSVGIGVIGCGAILIVLFLLVAK
jgi:hypothetical protein